MPRRLLAIAGLVALIAMLPFAIVGAGAAEPSRVSNLQLRFKVVFRARLSSYCARPDLFTGGRYALVTWEPAATRCASRLELFDDTSGSHSFISTSACTQANYPGGRPVADVEAFGPPWVLLECGQREKLYNIVTRRWRAFSRDGACDTNCTLPPLIGARWVEVYFQDEGSCGDGVHYSCGPLESRFINIRTGLVRGASTGPHTILDLNSPKLVVPICEPVRLTPYAGAARLGRYVVVQASTGSYVQRCGSARKIPVLPAGVSSRGTVLINPHGVLVQMVDSSSLDWSGSFEGIRVPSMHRFVTTAPADTRNPKFALNSRKLYVADQQGDYLAAPF